MSLCRQHTHLPELRYTPLDADIGELSYSIYGFPWVHKNQKPDVDVGSWAFHITNHMKFTLSDYDRYTSHFPS
jgi:hypothetical protein